jgi:D-methionine transport system ATP-binding protein
VGIARALAARPSVILADEPTSALDPTTTQEILGLLTDLRDELGVTILLITHDLSIVRQIADRVAVLQHGKVLAQGGLADVAVDPAAGLLPPLDAPPAPSGAELILNVHAGADATASFISALSRELNTDVRILDGEVLRLGDQSVSQFQLGLTGVDHSAADRCDDYVRWLQRHGLSVAGPRAGAPV